MAQIPESLFGLVAGRKPPSAQELIGMLLGNIGSENAHMEELFSALAKRRDEASQAEAAAKQNLEQARAAPIPTTDPTADLVTRALGSVAGTFTGSDKPSQNAQALIEAEQKKIMMKHAADLAALSDTYDKAYERANKMGDQEFALKIGEKRASLQEKRLSITSALGAQVDLERIKGGIEETKIRARATAGEEFNPSDYIDQSPSGVQYINISDIPSQKAKLKASNFAKQNKIATLNAIENNVINMVGDANANISSIRSLIVPELETDWKNVIGRGKKWLDSKTQKNPVLASYPAIRTAAIQFIQTIAGLGKGLRINQAEIQAALKFDIPEVTDTQDVANAKLDLLQMMVNHVERAALGLPENPQETQEFIKRSRDVHSQSMRIKKQIETGKVLVDEDVDKVNDVLDELGYQPVGPAKEP